MAVTYPAPGFIIDAFIRIFASDGIFNMELNIQLDAKSSSSPASAVIETPESGLCVRVISLDFQYQE